MRLYTGRRVALVVSAVVVIGALAWATGEALLEPSLQQPFPYNHKKHIDADWTCAACHVYVDQEAFASIPKARACVECHESEGVEKSDIPEFAELRRLVERGEDIPWIQIHRLPPHVYFSHRRHVNAGEIECVTCHGDMTQVTEPVTRQMVPIEMNRCIDCHKEKNVTIDCQACHR